MKTFVRLVSALPFSGKIGISPSYYKFLGSRTKSDQISNYYLLLLLLVVMVLCHGVQAQMGFEALSFNSPVWAKVISMIYAAVNILVVVVQAYLIYQTTVHLFKGRLCKTERPIHGFTSSEVLTAFLVTLGGQIAFLVPYIIYS